MTQGEHIYNFTTTLLALLAYVLPIVIILIGLFLTFFAAKEYKKLGKLSLATGFVTVLLAAFLYYWFATHTFDNYVPPLLALGIFYAIVVGWLTYGAYAIGKMKRPK